MTRVTLRMCPYDAVVLPGGTLPFSGLVWRLSFSLFLHLTPCSRRRGMQASLQDTPESVRQASVQILILPVPYWGVLGQLQDALNGAGRTSHNRRKVHKLKKIKSNT